MNPIVRGILKARKQKGKLSRIEKKEREAAKKSSGGVQRVSTQSLRKFTVNESTGVKTEVDPKTNKPIKKDN